MLFEASEIFLVRLKSASFTASKQRKIENEIFIGSLNQSICTADRIEIDRF